VLLIHYFRSLRVDQIESNDAICLSYLCELVVLCLCVCVCIEISMDVRCYVLCVFEVSYITLS